MACVKSSVSFCFIGLLIIIHIAQSKKIAPQKM